MTIPRDDTAASPQGTSYVATIEELSLTVSSMVASSRVTTDLAATRAPRPRSDQWQSTWLALLTDQTTSHAMDDDGAYQTSSHRVDARCFAFRGKRRGDADKTDQGTNAEDDRHKHGRDDGSHYHRLVTTVTLHGNRFPKVGRQWRCGFRSAPPPWTLGKVLSGPNPKGSPQEDRST